MQFKRLGILVIILSLALGIGLVIGCGDDDDDDNDDTGGGDDDDTGGGGSGKIDGYVRNFQDKVEVQGALVQLVDNETGQPLGDAFQATSPSGGHVSFSGIPEGVEYVGIKVSKEGNHDTYQYDFPVGAKEEEFLLVSRVTSGLVALTLELELDPTKGFAAGAVYYGDPTSEDPIGCTVVQMTPEPDDGIFYFTEDNLPDDSRNVLPTNAPENGASGTGVNPINGYWIGMNTPVGTAVDVTATVAVDRANDTTWEVETVNIPMTFADSVTIANIYFAPADYGANPQPAWCTAK